VLLGVSEDGMMKMRDGATGRLEAAEGSRTKDGWRRSHLCCESVGYR
jgi:hypothetical protein